MSSKKKLLLSTTLQTISLCVCIKHSEKCTNLFIQQNRLFNPNKVVYVIQIEVEVVVVVAVVVVEVVVVVAVAVVIVVVVVVAVAVVVVVSLATPGGEQLEDPPPREGRSASRETSLLAHKGRLEAEMLPHSARPSAASRSRGVAGRVVPAPTAGPGWSLDSMRISGGLVSEPTGGLIGEMRTGRV